MPSPVKAAYIKRAIMLAAPRAAQEKWMRKQGWARLVDRADVWFNPCRQGRDLHDVFTFRAALEDQLHQLIVAASGRAPAPKVHHHAGAPL